MSIMSFLRPRVGAAAFAVISVSPIALNEGPVEVTRRDIIASNEKVALAYEALVDMWTKDFRAIGQRFDPPRIARYTGVVRTACGVVRGNNAQYCLANNAIYYDEVFVAGMAKIAATTLGTGDGDMTGIGIIAHEMGHAVAMQLGHRSRDSYENEATADCLAGAFAHQAERDQALEEGDVEEAIFGMSMAGDPTPPTTGNDRYDSIIQARLARQSHGTKEQRVNNFKDGFENGAGACLEEFSARRVRR
jgi:uncharacterized protein